MKCKYCGGEIGLEEKICLYCGRPNEQAVLHHQNMARYRKRFDETEAAVIEKAEHYRRIVPRVILIVVLLIASAVMFAVSENALFFPERARHRWAEKNEAQVCALLDSCLERGDYISFSSYCSYYDIRTYNSPFEAYADIRWAADNYKDFVIRLERLFLHKDPEKWEAYSSSGDIRWLVNSLDNFLETVDNRRERVDSVLVLSYFDDMRDRVLNMLELYLGVQDTESFLALSESRKTVYIEEVLFDAEGQT